MRDEVLAAALRHGGAVSAAPSPAAAIARWRASTAPARCPALITQNIDNLHQASGIAAERRRRAARQHDLRDLPRLRASATNCRGCSEKFERSGGTRAGLRAAAATSRPRPSRSARRCRTTAMRRAEELTRDCDLFLAIGSSLVVWPAAGFPLMAKRNGAALVIINREPTEFDDIADLVVRDDIGDALAPFIAH